MVPLAAPIPAHKANTFKRCPSCGGDMEFSIRECCRLNRIPVKVKNLKRPFQRSAFVHLSDFAGKYALKDPVHGEKIPTPPATPATLEQTMNKLEGNTNG